MAASGHPPRGQRLAYDAGDVTAPPAEAPTKRKTLAAQNISRMCLVCGADNPFGLQARFYELEAPVAPTGEAAASAGAPYWLDAPLE